MYCFYLTLRYNIVYDFLGLITQNNYKTYD
jgi:hypothetical protein